MGDFAGLWRGLLKEENRANETSGITFKFSQMSVNQYFTDIFFAYIGQGPNY